MAEKNFEQFTKPFTLYSVSVLRYRGLEMHNSQKLGFLEKTSQKNHSVDIFTTFFGGKVVCDLVKV